MEIEALIHAILTLMPSQAISPLRKLLAIDGGVELLSRVVSTAFDPSVVTLKDITAEKEKMQLTSHYDW